MHSGPRAHQTECPLKTSSRCDHGRLCEQWWNAEECRQVTIDEEVGTLFLGWMHTHRLGRKRLLDTLLAATYHLAGVRRLATTDWRDFARYGVFDVVPLRPAGTH